MTMTVSDIGRILLTLDADVACTAAVPLISAHGQQWSILTIAAGESWSTTNPTSRALGLVVLEGHATCVDESGRQSVGSGHVIILGEGASQTLNNESKTPFRAVLAWTSTSTRGENE